MGEMPTRAEHREAVYALFAAAGRAIDARWNRAPADVQARLDAELSAARARLRALSSPLLSQSLSPVRPEGPAVTGHQLSEGELDPGATMPLHGESIAPASQATVSEELEA